MLLFFAVAAHAFSWCCRKCAYSVAWQAQHGFEGCNPFFAATLCDLVQQWYEYAGLAGSRYFCGSFYGHPSPTSGKNYATANAFGGPSRPASLVAYPTRGMQHSYRNDSTRFRKACIFTTLCSVKTHALSLLGTTRLLSRSEGFNLR